MRYNQIRECDIANGDGIGIALFVQGCHFRCPGCFNSETWDFNDGKEWTDKIQNKFIELAKKPYIKRISILGGEPLAKNNLNGVLKLVNQIRLLLPKKTIWLYSGYTWEQLFEDDNFDIEGSICENQTRRAIVLSTDVFVDGRYIEEQRDIALKWCGSSNQRVIDVQKSLKKREVVLWDTL